MKAAYRRLVIKLSGDQLAGSGGFGIDPTVIAAIAGELREVHELGTQMGVVIGGGNVIRGITASAEGIDRVAADYMGMLASVMNALALQDSLEKSGVDTRLLSAIEIKQVAEPQIRRRVSRHLEKGRVVIFAGGTGNPFFTTDTGAALRAMEIGADLLLKGTRVDGIFDADPEKVPGAKLYDRLTYHDFLTLHLGVMDATAVALCQDNELPIVVFNMSVPGNIVKIVCGEAVGTTVGP